MGIFDNTSLDPNFDATLFVWPETLAEIEARGLEIHGSLSKRSVVEGATAVVFKATETKSGRAVAVKVYKDPTIQVKHRNGKEVSIINYFDNECVMLAGLQKCPLVPRYYYSVATKDETLRFGQTIQPFHVMEFVEGQRVTEYAKATLNRGDKIANRIGLAQSVFAAIESIHQFGYLHRDLSDGNILVDKDGAIRLIDLAEASPLGSEHTRLVSTPGLGTAGVASQELQSIRKIQTDDVRDACTIAYAIFTGLWKETGEGPDSWRRKLARAGVPARIAQIIIKGMKDRDPSQRRDPAVWNTAREVHQAIESYLRSLRRRRKLVRLVAFSMLAALGIVAVGLFVGDRIQRQAYTTQLGRLKDSRIVLSEKPQADRVDARVQQKIKTAESLELQAVQSNLEGRHGDAVQQLRQAEVEIEAATQVADNLHRLRPLLDPLRKLLLDNKQWNHSCPSISRSLTRLGHEYQSIFQQVEAGEPEQAWTLIANLQPELARLIDDNQQSFEISGLMSQLDSQFAGLDPELRKLNGFEQVSANRARATQYFEDGRWTEARTELLGGLVSLKSFLAANETDVQRQKRLAANAELLNEKIAATEVLQRQVQDLTAQIATAKQQYDEVLFRGARYQEERDDTRLKLSTATQELSTTQSVLQQREAELTSIIGERDELFSQVTSLESQIKTHMQELEQGRIVWTEQNTELEKTQAELKQTRALLARLAERPDQDIKSIQQQLQLVETLQNVVKSDPTSWDEANRLLVAELQKYESLLQDRQQAEALGKTARHADMIFLDDQLKTQFQIVVVALQKRDQQDVKEWTALQSQIDYQVQLRQAKVHEGWAESSDVISQIAGVVEALTQYQKSHQAGKTRYEKDGYRFQDWAEISGMPEVQSALARIKFSDLALGTKFTNSVGQSMIYLPPGEFEMGSPEGEVGRDDDEQQHAITIAQGFFLADTEATQAAYRRVTGKTPWMVNASLDNQEADTSNQFQGGNVNGRPAISVDPQFALSYTAKVKDYVQNGDDYPAVYVSWDDAVEFVKQLNKIERENGSLPPNWEYRLPTEAQWEYACRANSTTRFCFGDDESQLGEYAWHDKYAWDIDEKYPHRVAQKKPNRWGFYDLHGNVFEWTADVYAAYPSDTRDGASIVGDSLHVFRGGSFANTAAFCRSANRFSKHPSGTGPRNASLGFRVACVPISRE